MTGTTPDPTILDRIRLGTRAILRGPWPGADDLEFVLRPLSRNEILEADQRASEEARARELHGVVMERVTRADGVTLEITAMDGLRRDEQVAIALRESADPSRPLFKAADLLRDALTEDEIGYFYRLLGEHTASVRPLTSAQSAESQALAEAALDEILKSTAPARILNALPLGMLRGCAAIMAERLQTSPTTKSSST